MKVKTKYSTSHFKLWKENILAKMKEKITDNKQKIKLKQVKPVLSDPDVKKHQEELHRKIVIVTSIKYQTILHLYVENTTFLNNYQKVLQIKLNIQHQHI